MKKRYLFFVTIVCTIAVILYFNKDYFLNFLDNDELREIEIIKTVSLNNFFGIDGTSTNLIVVGTNYLQGFSNHGNENFDFNVSLKNAVTDANGDYFIVGEKDGSKVYMINSNAKIWETNIQGNILNVSVNKNGYSTVIYKQVGYKSLIKVIKPDGSELFTTYLGSTYAIDAEISNDNKELAIAEINTEGTKIESIVERINMTDLEMKNKTKIEVEEDTLISNIEFDSKNRLLIQTDKNIQLIEKDGIQKRNVEFSNATQIATIENRNNPITIEKIESGIFDTNFILKIHSFKDDEILVKNFEMDKNPTYITAKNDKIVILLEKELAIVNLNGKLIGKYEISGNVKSMMIFDDGNTLALVYRDKIEFVRI